MNRDIPQKVSIEMIKAAKEYASVDAGGFIVNDPRQYKAFRDGQDYGYLLAVSLSHQGENQRASVARDEDQGVAADTQISLSDYPAAARVIALYLKPYCNEDLAYPDMIAQAARDAAAELERLRGEREALARKWYLKAFTNFRPFKELAEKQFEELWSRETAKPQQP